MSDIVQSDSFDLENGIGDLGTTGHSTVVEDVAAQYSRDGQDCTYSEEEGARLRRKLDWRLLPMLWFSICLGACDKVATATAALYGLEKDTNSVGGRYAWIGSAFYFGYLVASIPASRLLQYFPIAKVLATAQFSWGIILIETGFVGSYPSLFLLRVILGMLEAPIVPGCFLIISMWYTKKEQSIRCGLMYTGLSVIITGPIGWSVGFIEGLDTWRAIFWITGALSILWAPIILFLLPDGPTSAKFINERQKKVSIERVRINQTGVENKHFKSTQACEALKDPKTWLMFFFNIFANFPNGGLTNFTPSIIHGLHYSDQESALLNIPTGLVQTASSYICSGGVFFFSAKFSRMQMRGTFILFGLLVSMVSSVFLYVLSPRNYTGRLMALYMSSFYLGPYVVSLSLTIANTAGYTKKVVVNSVVFMAYCISNICGPHFFKSGQAPLYPLGIGSILCCYGLAMVTITLYMSYCCRENRLRGNVDVTTQFLRHDETDFKDLTDIQNPHFRYIY